MAQKILLVEDDQMMLSLLQFKLQKEGFSIVAVGNGKEALDKIGLEEFNLIITDIMMPMVSGLELVSKVRNEFKKTTPIIVVSNAGQEDMVMQAFELGADNFIRIGRASGRGRGVWDEE